MLKNSETMSKILVEETKKLGVHFNSNTFAHKDSVGANLAFSDCENIYWKVYQPLYVGRAIKDIQVSAMLENFVPTFSSLSTEILELCDGYVATLWPWVDVTPVVKKNEYEVLEIVSKIHSLPSSVTPDMPPRDINALRELIESRCVKASLGNPTYEILKGLPTRLHESVVQLSEGKEKILCHGDAHGQNFGVNSGSVIIFDWELCSTDTREWDLSLLLLSHYWGDKHHVTVDDLDGDKDYIKASAAFRASSQVARFLANGRVDYAAYLFEDIKNFAPDALSKKQLALFD